MWWQPNMYECIMSRSYSATFSQYLVWKMSDNWKADEKKASSWWLAKSYVSRISDWFSSLNLIQISFSCCVNCDKNLGFLMIRRSSSFPDWCCSPVGANSPSIIAEFHCDHLLAGWTRSLPWRRPKTQPWSSTAWGKLWRIEGSRQSLWPPTSSLPVTPTILNIWRSVMSDDSMSPALLDLPAQQ